MRQFSWELDSNWAQTFRLYAIGLGIAALGAGLNVLFAAGGVRSPFLLLGIGIAGLGATFLAWRAVEDWIAARHPREVVLLGSYASANATTDAARGGASLSTATLAAAAVSAIILVGPQKLPSPNDTSVGSQLVPLVFS